MQVHVHLSHSLYLLWRVSGVLLWVVVWGAVVGSGIFFFADSRTDELYFEWLKLAQMLD